MACYTQWSRRLAYSSVLGMIKLERNITPSSFWMTHAISNAAMSIQAKASSFCSGTQSCDCLAQYFCDRLHHFLCSFRPDMFQHVLHKDAQYSALSIISHMLLLLHTACRHSTWPVSLSLPTSDFDSLGRVLHCTDDFSCNWRVCVTHN